MRFEWLFLRWLVIIGLVAIALRYRHALGGRGESTHYQKVILLQGERSSGPPLAGVAVDPAKREVIGLLGKPQKSAAAAEFFILWKARDGRSYGATISDDGKGVTGICEISPEGAMRTLYEDRGAVPEIAESHPRAPETSEEALRIVMDALPTDSDLPRAR